MSVLAQECCGGDPEVLRVSSSGGWGVVMDNGVFWLVTPEGEKFYGCGLNGADAGCSPETVQGRPAYDLWNLYPSIDTWAVTLRDRLVKWGFNHLGAWTFAEENIGLPYIPNLDLGWFSQALWFDPFDPALATRVNQWADRLTAPHRHRGLRIGYFPDNEVGWWNAALFRFYLSEGWQNNTKRLLWQLLYDRYEGKWEKLLDDWMPSKEAKGFKSLQDARATLKLRPGGSGIRVLNEFTYLCADRYYKLIHDGLRAADPHALIFSDRLPIYYSQDAVRAMAPYVDVVAVNYNLDGPDGWVAHYFFEGLAALADRPVLVSEFFCGAMENRSGNKNTGHLLKVPTQRERARVVRQALRNFARFPNIVGTQWFQYYDEPQGGREDGEDYNMGLVDIHDRPYEEVVASFQCTNPLLPRLHAAADPGRRDVRDSPIITISRASSTIDISDGSLTDWDKEKTLMRGFAAEPPYVPFADIYLTWDANGLYLATIGMDYMHPKHLSCEGSFPLSETYQVHLLVLIGDRAYHFAIHFIPRKVTFSAADPTNGRGSIALIPRLYTYPPDGQPRSLAGATVQYLNASAPRISCEAHFPPQVFGLPCFKEEMKLKMNIVVLSHYRGHEMFWSEGTAARTFARPAGWRVVTLR
ncbi:MAG: hypothetical protein ACREQW_20825 [Candidatus Binatia bacterium]